MVVGRGLSARYGSAEGAAAYARKYDRSLARRLSARREAALLRHALHEAGAEGVLLDVPCGAGRLTPVLLERERRVTAVDASAAMVEAARHALAGPIAEQRVVLGVADVERLPFDDGAFDTVVCWRLLHHVVQREARVALLSALARIARRAVIISFADAETLRARTQRWRRRGRRCTTLSRDELAAEAAAAGLTLGATKRLASWFSLLAVAVLRPASPAP